MLSASRALVIEEEALVAFDIQDVLSQHGVSEIELYRRVSDALPHAERLRGFDIAIVEAKLGAAEVVAFTAELAAAGVGTIVMSADRAAPQLFPHAVALAKPFDVETLIAACATAQAR